MKQLPKKIDCYPYASSVMKEVQHNRTKLNEIIRLLNQRNNQSNTKTSGDTKQG